MAGHNLDKGIFAVLVRDGLEHEGGGHTAGRDHELLGLDVLAYSILYPGVWDFRRRLI